MSNSFSRLTQASSTASQTITDLISIFGINSHSCWTKLEFPTQIMGSQILLFSKLQNDKPDPREHYCITDWPTLQRDGEVAAIIILVVRWKYKLISSIGAQTVGRCPQELIGGRTVTGDFPTQTHSGIEWKNSTGSGLFPWIILIQSKEELPNFQRKSSNRPEEMTNIAV